MMDLEFRDTQITDVDALFEVRANTRQNPLSRAALAELGITPESTSSALINGTIVGSVCALRERVVGFCSGAVETGEILVLAVLPEYEGHRIGTQLLDRVVTCLRNAGAQRLWLAAAADPTVRAHGFYRALGWRATGERTANGDEILELAVPPRNEELLKRWKITETLLERARRALPEPAAQQSPEYEAHLAEYHEFLAHNELGLAFDTLESLGAQLPCRGGFWRDLERAAENMGRVDKLPALRKRFSDALE